MPSHSLPAAPPQPLTIAPGQSIWLGLAPGSTLHATRECVTVHWAPQACGQALHTPLPTLLQAGEPLHGTSQTQATWVQLHNPSRSPAELELVETAPAPAWRLAFWQRLRNALGRDEPAAQNPHCGSAWHAAR